jgi:hypothetical protein
MPPPTHASTVAPNATAADITPQAVLAFDEARNGQQANEKDAASIVHKEDSKDVQYATVPVTAFDDMPLWETVKTFRKTILICTGVLWIACLDGYQLTLPSNLSAESSFIGASVS